MVMGEEDAVDRGNLQGREGGLDIAIAAVNEEGVLASAHNPHIAAAVVYKEHCVELRIACAHGYVYLSASSR